MVVRVCEFCARRIEAFEARCVCREQEAEEARQRDRGRFAPRRRCDYCRRPLKSRGRRTCRGCAAALKHMENRLQCSAYYARRKSRSLAPT